VTSDAHTGLKQATPAVLQGSAWQRYRVHFKRKVLANVTAGSSEMVTAAIRTIVAQPAIEHVHEQFDVIATMLGRQSPKVEDMLHEAKGDLLGFAAFQQSYWRQVWSTNPLERLSKEDKRRTNVVGVFPNPAALLRLSGAILAEQHDEWVARDRRYFSEASMTPVNIQAGEKEGQVNPPELMTA